MIVFLIISGNGGRFSGGFDINVFQQVHKTGTQVSSVVKFFFIVKSCVVDNIFSWAGDISLMPEVSIDLVCNLMEGI